MFISNTVTAVLMAPIALQSAVQIGVCLLYTSAYMPVLKESNNIKALEHIIKEEKIDMNHKAYDCLKTVLRDFDNTKFYTTKSFENG